MRNIENNTKMQCFHNNKDLSYEFQLESQTMSPTLQHTNTSPKWSTTTISKWVSVATQLQNYTAWVAPRRKELFLAAQLTRKSSSFELSELPWCVCVCVLKISMYCPTSLWVQREQEPESKALCIRWQAGSVVSTAVPRPLPAQLCSFPSHSSSTDYKRMNQDHHGEWVII